MTSSHADFLSRLEERAAQHRQDDLYLWPRTPLGHDHQATIAQRVGVPDSDVLSPRSRPTLIIRQIRALLRCGLVEPEFSLLDIACGDAIVLWQIQKAFPRAHCYGIDCNKGRFGTHDAAQRQGIALFKGFIQHLFASDPPVPFDLALMLNTYRGWESADLREHERDLPDLADAWLAKNARYGIVTATDAQILRMRNAGVLLKRLGKGEDDSTMVCISKLRIPRLPWWEPLLSRAARLMGCG